MIKKSLIILTILLTLTLGLRQKNMDKFMAEDDLFEWNSVEIIDRV
jgi:hypothetical protein